MHVPPSNSFVTFAIVLNIVASISIVLLNKWIYTVHGFPNVSLTCLHFIVTTVGLFLCQKVNIFQPKTVPIMKMLPLSLTFCGFVVFTNLSLESNTVGTYQLIKMLTTPCIMVIQTMFYNKTFSTSVRLTVVSRMLGYSDSCDGLGVLNLRHTGLYWTYVEDTCMFVRICRCNLGLDSR
jgi:solute carrier family 35 protein E3